MYKNTVLYHRNHGSNAIIAYCLLIKSHIFFVAKPNVARPHFRQILDPPVRIPFIVKKKTSASGHTLATTGQSMVAILWHVHVHELTLVSVDSWGPF